MTPDEALHHFAELKTAYGLAFGGPHGAAVLTNLAPFCRARSSCVVPGARDKTFVLEGRREVWLRIQTFLDHTPEQLVTIFTTNDGAEQ